MTLPARRHAWKKKRWTAALAVCLAAVGYPLALGPVGYFANRGWLPVDAFKRSYDPLFYATRDLPLHRAYHLGYLGWCLDLGTRHRGSN